MGWIVLDWQKMLEEPPTLKISFSTFAQHPGLVANSPSSGSHSVVERGYHEIAWANAMMMLAAHGCRQYGLICVDTMKHDSDGIA